MISHAAHPFHRVGGQYPRCRTCKPTGPAWLLTMNLPGRHPIHDEFVGPPLVSPLSHGPRDDELSWFSHRDILRRGVNTANHAGTGHDVKTPAAGNQTQVSNHRRGGPDAGHERVNRSVARCRSLVHAG